MRDKAPHNRTQSAGLLNATEIHQEHSKVADHLAKTSTGALSPEIPEELERNHVPPVSILIDRERLKGTDPLFQNNPAHLFQKLYNELRLNYHIKGKWHIYLFDSNLWMQPTLSILHGRKDYSLCNFLVQVLGRTIPTFHRLKVVRAGLFPYSTRQLCNQGADESLEHIMYRCPYSTNARQTLIRDLMTILRKRRVQSTDQACRQMLTKTLLTPTEVEERYRSASQIPLTLQTGLTKTGKMSMDTTEKIGRKLHRIIVTTYQKIWHHRCDEMKTRKLLFNDRMEVFLTQKPV
jgi:hypothetical protein